MSGTSQEVVASLLRGGSPSSLELALRIALAVGVEATFSLRPPAP